MPNTNTNPHSEKKSTRQSRPAHLNRVLIRPVFGEPRMVHATPATSGGANSGRMLAAAIKPLKGVLVRTTIQENASPITTAIKVPPPQAIRVLNSASATFGLASTARKLVIERWRRLKPSTTGLVSVRAPKSRVRGGWDN